jgi:hypothetical protein
MSLMKKPLVVMLICGPLTLLLVILLALKDRLPFPEVCEHVLPHATVGIFITFLAALIAWFVGENLERFDPLIETVFERLSKDIREGIEGSLLKMNTTIADGFGRVASGLAQEFRGVSEAWTKGLSDTHVQQNLLDSVQSPTVKKLIRAGEISKAIAQLDEILVKDQSERREQIAVLLLSANEKDWASAVEIMDRHEDVREPRFFLTLAYRFWSVKQLEQSIRLAEQGLALVGTKDPMLISRFENSLAYYYADARKEDREDAATRYAEAAVKARPGESGPLDTLGFVKITYSRTREGILEGVDLCNRAMKMGGDFDLYTKHVARASQRLEQLRNKQSDAK